LNANGRTIGADVAPGGEIPERRFLGWDQPALPLAAAVLAEHYRDGDSIDMGAATLVLPGGRAGRRLKELLVQETAARGARLLPPRITTVGQLPELLHDTDAPLAGDALRLRLWSRALSGMPAAERAELFVAPPETGDIRGWTTLAAGVDRLHREVGSAGLRFAEVAGRCAEGLLWDDGARWRALAGAQARYEAEAAAVGYADPDLARMEALAAGRVAARTEVWLLGVAEIPELTRRMLRAAAAGGAAVHALVHAPAEEADAFDALGCVRAEAWLDRAVPIPDERIEVRPRPADQAAAAAGAIARLDGRYGPDEIVVAVPDAELEPYLDQRLAAAGVETRAADGIPLERTAPFRLLQAAAEMLDGLRFEALAALARHPDVSSWLRAEARADRTTAPGPDFLAALDAYFCEHLPERLSPAPGEPDRRSADAVRALRNALEDRLLGAFRGRKPISAWAEEALRLLERVYAARPLDGSPRAEQLLAACEAIGRAAGELRRLPPAVDEPCSAADGVRLLLDACRGAAVAPDPRREAVELLGWLEMHLDDTPVGIVTGFNEPFIPESVNAHAFLPNALRARLGLVDNDRRYARYAYQLTAMLASRAELRLIAGRRTASGDPLRPSRLMFAVQGPALARRVRRFYGDDAEARPPAAVDEAGDPMPEPIPGPPATSAFRLPPEPVLVLDALPPTIPVTAFASILRDPYRWVLERVFRLGSIDDSARELDGGGFGSLAHRVLEWFGRSEVAGSDDEAVVRAALHAMLDDAAARAHGPAAHPAVRVQVEQLRARLDAFAAWQARRVAAGWRIVGVECRTPAAGVPWDVDGVPIALSGRIDRIDHHAASGRWQVLDYKTSDTARSPEDTHRAGRVAERRWVDLQLPLYRHLLADAAAANGSRPGAAAAGADVEYGYLVLPRDLEETGERLAEWDAVLLAQADETAREAIRMLRRGEIPFDPDAAGFPDDPFAALFGRGHLRAALEAAEEEAP
jgi:ATP-dependent helicase/nuclease subunit B